MKELQQSFKPRVDTVFRNEVMALQSPDSEQCSNRREIGLEHSAGSH